MTHSSAFFLRFMTAFLCLLLWPSYSISANTLRVAVASNFNDTLTTLAHAYEQQTGNKVIIITGSTGKLYAQIKNGAPYDAFFSADKDRVVRLEQEGFGLPESRFTYAYGKIVLWSPKTDYVDAQGRILTERPFKFLAIANPKLAPYGQAAFEVLQKQGLWKQLDRSMVRGENIGQTYQFVKSGNAQLGFVALSQIKQQDTEIPGSFWLIPQTLYQPIEQQAMQLKNNPVATDFLAFVKSKDAQAIIHKSGYGVDLAQ